MTRWKILAGVASCALMMHVSQAFAQSALVSPFNVAHARSVWADKLKSDKGDFECPPVPAPVVQFEGVSRYCDDDKTRSVVCPDKEAKYEAASKEIDAFNSTLVELANRYVKAKKPRAEVAQCVLSHLYSWAKAGAWAPDTAQGAQIGEFKRGVSLAANAAAYLLIHDDPTLDAGQKQTVEAWFKSLAHPMIDYANAGEKEKRNSAFANHRYWQGLAAAQVGIATQDSAIFQWGIGAYGIGMMQVQPNGVLPIELARAKKGFGYHLFAIQPLVMLEEILRVNGYGTQTGETANRMRALMSLIVPLIPADEDANGVFEYKDPYNKIKDNQLAWLEIFANTHPDMTSNPTLAQQLAILKDRREKTGNSLRSSALGGDMTFLFGNP